MPSGIYTRKKRLLIRVIKKCEICSKEFKVYPSRKKTAKFCSKKCKKIGNGIRMMGHEVTIETRKKISMGNKGQVPWTKGRKLTEKHKNKISKANKGRKLSKESLKRVRKHLKELGKNRIGTNLSEETKRKIGKKNKIKMKENWKKEAYRNNMIEKMTGKKNPHKGKTFEEIHGKEKAIELKKKISEDTKRRLKTGNLKKFNPKRVRINKIKYSMRKGIRKPNSHWIWFENYGLFPKSNEVLHHIDFNERNDDIKNLKLMTRGGHSKLHLNI